MPEHSDLVQSRRWDTLDNPKATPDCSNSLANLEAAQFLLHVR